MTRQATSSYSRSLGLYINCVEEDGYVTESHITSRPLGKQTKKGASATIARFLDRGEGDLSAIKVRMSGTPFQNEVWTEIRKIPPGSVMTYGEVAKRVGRPGAARAVGSAMKSNNLVILVPCHRIVSSGGLGGYSAHGGTGTKKKILEIESMLPAGSRAGRAGRKSKP